MQYVVVLSAALLVACTGRPAPREPEPAAPAPVAARPSSPRAAAIAVEVTGERDLPAATVRIDGPLRLGQPAVVHLELVAPETVGFAGTYDGFTDDFPMKLEVSAPGSVIDPPKIKARQSAHAVTKGDGRRLRFRLTVTPGVAGPLPFEAKLTYSVCSDLECWAHRAELRWTSEVAP